MPDKLTLTLGLAHRLCDVDFTLTTFGGPLKVRPSKLFSLTETWLRNKTESLWQLASDSWYPFGHMFPASSLSKLVNSCPPFLLVAYLFQGVALNHVPAAMLGEEFNTPTLVQHSAGIASRMRDLAVSAHQITRDGSNMRLLRKMFRHRWRALDRSPDLLWRAAGCWSSQEVLTVCDLIDKPPSRAEMTCLARHAVFSPRSYFASPTSARVPSALDLYETMRPYLSVRNAKFEMVRMTHIFAFILQEYLSTASTLDGLLLEFGVSMSAQTMTLLSHHVESIWQRERKGSALPRIYGFDSFQGLPRDWNGHKQGTFGPQGDLLLPAVKDNVHLVIGWFNETVRAFLQGVTAGALAAGARVPTIALVHLDADLYESTRLVMELLLPFLSEGTVLVMDDLLNIEEQTEAAYIKENWDALFEILKLEDWRWDLEVLAAPWLLPTRNFVNTVGSGAAFRLVAPQHSEQ